MVVLLTGASGFIGRHLAAALRARGHVVREASRQSAAPTDFTRDHDSAVWLPRLAGVDAVVNAAGILRERGPQRFDAIHRRAPCALFEACAQAGVRRVLHISALGADAGARSAYHRSKRDGDDCLESLPLTGIVLQPSLVYGPGGSSAQLFTMLASLPLIPLPGDGGQQVQPIHIDDLCAVVLALLEAEALAGGRLALVGPQPLALRDFLAQLRQAMGLGRPQFLPLPLPLVRAAAAVGSHLSGSLLDRDTLQMLQRGNTADASATRRWLGHAPRAVSQFVAPAEAEGLRAAALMRWMRPVLRLSIALLWIVTGLLSLGLYPVAQSYALLARAGISGALAPFALYGAALLDLALGLALLLRPGRWLWLAQIALILAYTLIISWKLPEFWLHPYGPVLKNLPLLACLWLLYEWERPRWST